MAHGHSLKSQAMVVDTQALGTLAGRTALLLNTTQNAMTATFLMKRIRYFLQLMGRTTGDDGPLLIGICKGDATIGEIANALLESNSAGPGDTSQVLDEDLPWAVWQDSVRQINYAGSEVQGQMPDHWMKLGKNGFPALEGTGYALFVFNAGSAALTTGGTINGIVHTQGVWLRD